MSCLASTHPVASSPLARKIAATLAGAKSVARCP